MDQRDSSPMMLGKNVSLDSRMLPTEIIKLILSFTKKCERCKKQYITNEFVCEGDYSVCEWKSRCDSCKIPGLLTHEGPMCIECSTTWLENEFNQ